MSKSAPQRGAEGDAGIALGAKLAGLLTRGAQGWRAPRVERELEVLETLSMGGRRQLMLVRCGAERFLVGAGQDAITTIVRAGCAESTMGEQDGDGQP